MEYIVRKPTPSQDTQASIIYSKTLKQCMEDNIMLKYQLNEYLEKIGIWNDEKEKTYREFIKNINEKQDALNKGNISLKQAKKIAIELKISRVQFRNLIAERTAYDSTTAEGIADDAKFNYLVSVCVLDPKTKKPIFKNLEDYNERASEDWVIKAASDLASAIYGLDSQYEDNLPENKFLKSYKFVNKDGQFINKDGHLVEINLLGEERLIDEDGEYIAYDENGKSYKVDYNGNKVEAFSPFLDDDGNPIIIKPEEEEKIEETSE